MNETKKPIHQMKLGRVRAAIWENQSAKNVFYNATFSRLYLEESGNKKPAFKDSTSFGRDDLLNLAKLADLVHTWIASRKKAANE